MRRRVSVGLSLLVALVAAGVGCQPKQSAQPPAKLLEPTLKKPLPVPEASNAGKPAVDASNITIAVVSNAVSPFWEAVNRGMENAGAELGCRVSFAGPAKSLVAEQKRILENYVSKGVSGIAVSPLEAKAIRPVIDEIVDGGIPVVTIDSDVPDSKRYCYIGTNNLQAGAVLGEKAKELLPKGATCVCFVGTMTVQNAQERVKGFTDAVATKGIKVLDTLQDQTDKNKARKNVEDIIQKYPDIDALVGIWSYNLPAIAEAVKEANKHDKIKVLGFDAEPATIQGLEKGEIDAAVVQKPYQFGYLSVHILFALATKDEATLKKLVPENKIIDTGVDLWTPQNVAEMKKKLEALGLKSS